MPPKKSTKKKKTPFPWGKVAVGAALGVAGTMAYVRYAQLPANPYQPTVGGFDVLETKQVAAAENAMGLLEEVRGQAASRGDARAEDIIEHLIDRAHNYGMTPIIAAHANAWGRHFFDELDEERGADITSAFDPSDLWQPGQVATPEQDALAAAEEAAASDAALMQRQGIHLEEDTDDFYFGE